MQIPLIQFAAEFTQSLAAHDCEDRSLNSGFSFYAAQNDVINRYGVGGDDLLFEYRNEIYSVFEDGRAPVGVLFH